MSHEPGTPLMEALGGMNLTMASTGTSFCGNVLKACGYDVKEESGMAKSGPGNDIGGLVLAANKPPAPSV